MAWYNNIMRRSPIDTKASQAASVMVINPGQPVWTPRDYLSFAKEAYGQNVVAYQAINKIAEAIASVEFLVFQGDRELPEHPVLQLIKRPNPLQSKSDYLHAKVGYYMIAGNGYEERLVVGGQIRELYQLRPDRMKVVMADSGLPERYVYQVGNKASKSWQFDAKKFTCDVRHTKRFHPTNDFYGLSPIEPTAFAIDQSNQGMAWLQALLQNSARPSGALTVNGDSTLTTEQFNRLKTQIEEQYSGARNAGRPMLLEGGLDWKPMGLSPTDMGIIEAKLSAARDVSLGLGVPPQLLGIPGDNTYSNYKEARLAFWEDTAIPMLQQMVEDWNAWFGQVYPGIEIRPNLDEIPAIVDKRKTLWEMADKSTDLTIDERRELKGYEPLPNGSGATILVSSSVLPLTMAIEPEPLPELPVANPEPPDDELSADDVKALVYGMSYA